METTGGIVNGRKFIPEVVAIIQARMNSKRLPGKSMLELGGKPLVAHVIERAKAINNVKTVVLATGAEEENRPLIDLAREMGAEVYAGSESNVLERYYLANKKYGGDYIARITGDNPFTDVEYASMAVEIAVESGTDLSSLTNLPLGTAIEVIKSEALDSAYEMSDSPYHFEHVTPYIKEHPELFSIERHDMHLKIPFENLRLTVDTEEDFDFAKKIYDEIYKGTPFNLEEVINFLKENPHLTTINKNIQQRPMIHSENQS